jgi:hypothetical protein
VFELPTTRRTIEVLLGASASGRHDIGMQRPNNLSFRNRVIAIAGLTLLSVALSGCGRDSDESQIRQLIETAEHQVEGRSTSGVMELIDKDYRDAQGYDRQQLQQFLRGYFLTHPHIELWVQVDTLTIATPTLAKARISVIVVGTAGSKDGAGKLRPDGDAVDLEVEFERGDDGWRVRRADRVRA